MEQFTTETISKIEELQREFDVNKNITKARQLCNEILSAEPKNFMAIGYSAVINSRSSTVENPQIAEISNEVQSIVSIIREFFADDKDYLSLCHPWVVVIIARVEMQIFTVFATYWIEQKKEWEKIKQKTDGATAEVKEKSSYDERREVLIYAERELLTANKIIDDAAKICFDAFSSMSEAVYNVCTEIINNVKDQNSISEDILGIIEEVIDRSHDHLATWAQCKDGEKRFNEVEEKYNGIKEWILQKRKELKAIEINEYWKQRAEEKKNLEKECNDLEIIKEKAVARLKEIRNGEVNIPSLDLLIKKQDEIGALEEQKKELGLFKFKEKKALQEQIKALRVEEVKLKTEVAAEKDKIRKEFVSTMADLEKTVARLKEIYDRLLLLNKDEESVDNK